jgi:hypothetical protein
MVTPKTKSALQPPVAHDKIREHRKKIQDEHTVEDGDWRISSPTPGSDDVAEARRARHVAARRSDS